MPPKRKATTQKTRTGGGGPAKRRKPTQAMVNVAKKIVAQQLNRNIETKQSNRNVATMNFVHNQLTVIDSQVLATSPGVNDPMTTDTSNRIGDEINLRGVSIRFIIELARFHSDCTFRIMLIRSAKNDTPTVTSLFNGLSGCKLIDTLNRERFTVMYAKTFKVTARNQGLGTAISATNAQKTGTAATDPLTGVGYLDATIAGNNVTSLGLATRICKIWIPGSKFARNRVIRYENGTSQPKFFQYHLVATAYGNAETDSQVAGPTGTVNCGVMKHYICQMYYKDA